MRCNCQVPHGGSSAEKPWNCKGLYGDSAEAAVNRIESVERPWSNISPYGNRSADAPMERRTVLDMRSDREVPHGSSKAEKPWNCNCPCSRKRADALLSSRRVDYMRSDCIVTHGKSAGMMSCTQSGFFRPRQQLRKHKTEQRELRRTQQPVPNRVGYICSATRISQYRTITVRKSAKHQGVLNM